MADYAKKTVAELQEILKSRGLASSGKKADLVARLNEADKAAETKEPEPEPQSEPIVEDVVPAGAAEQATGEAPTTTTTQQQPTGEATQAEAAAPSVDDKTFTLNLAASDVDKEMEKRKARAERFKTGGQASADAEATETATADTDALKNLERAKRFGTGQTAIGMLDSALSSERERGPRGKKRVGGPVEETATLDDPGLKQNFNRRGRHGRDKRRNGPPGAKPSGVVKSGATAFTDDKDRAAAEARKKRFAAAS